MEKIKYNKYILKNNEKKDIEKRRPAHVSAVLYESPEKLMGVFNESVMVKMELEVTMDVCGERLWASRAC